MSRLKEITLYVCTLKNLTQHFQKAFEVHSGVN